MSLQNELASANDVIAAKQAALAGLLSGITELSGTKASERVDEVRKANEELAELAEKRDALQAQVKEIDKATAHVKNMREPVQRQVTPVGEEDESTPVAKTIKSLLADSADYQQAIKSGRQFRGHIGDLDFDEATKTLSTTADMIGPNQRLSLLPMAVETRTVADMMLQGTTGATTLEYYEETTLTNAAAEVAEAGLKPESAVDFTLRTEAVRKIATWIPVTDEMLADNEGFESYLRGRLGFMIQRREETQLLVGDGTAPNISGITDRSGIQTQAKGSDPTPDAIYKAMNKIRTVAFAEPTGVVLHPNDWEPIRLLRTADGIYIWGSPSEAGPERIWGLPIRLTTAMTENTGLVGAFRPDAQIFRRTGISISVSDSHSDYFIYNKLAVRAEERIALAVYRPASFCTVTGI